MSIQLQLIENFHFKAFGEDGEILNCEGLFTLDSVETGKSYIVYTDHSITDEGYENVFANVFSRKAVAELDVTDPMALVEVDLGDIATDEEWDLIDSALAQYDEILSSEEHEIPTVIVPDFAGANEAV